MGRRKIEITPITHERNRSVTFLKRKNGLFKKAYELGVLASVDVAVIIFEERGGQHIKLHEYCSTNDVQEIVQRHLQFKGDRESKGPQDFNAKFEPSLEDDDEDDEDDRRRGGPGGSGGYGGPSSSSGAGPSMGYSAYPPGDYGQLPQQQYQNQQNLRGGMMLRNDVTKSELDYKMLNYRPTVPIPHTSPNTTYTSHPNAPAGNPYHVGHGLPISLVRDHYATSPSLGPTSSGSRHPPQKILRFENRNGSDSLNSSPYLRYMTSEDRAPPAVYGFSNTDLGMGGSGTGNPTQPPFYSDTGFSTRGLPSRPQSHSNPDAGTSRLSSGLRNMNATELISPGEYGSPYGSGPERLSSVNSNGGSGTNTFVAMVAGPVGRGGQMHSSNAQSLDWPNHSTISDSAQQQQAQQAQQAQRSPLARERTKGSGRGGASNDRRRGGTGNSGEGNGDNSSSSSSNNGLSSASWLDFLSSAAPASASGTSDLRTMSNSSTDANSNSNAHINASNGYNAGPSFNPRGGATTVQPSSSGVGVVAGVKRRRANTTSSANGVAEAGVVKQEDDGAYGFGSTERDTELDLFELLTQPSLDPSGARGEGSGINNDVKPDLSTALESGPKSVVGDGVGVSNVSYLIA